MDHPGRLPSHQHPENPAVWGLLQGDRGHHGGRPVAVGLNHDIEKIEEAGPCGNGGEGNVKSKLL